MKRRALVADDSRIFRAFIRDPLQDHGFEVLEAANGQEALAIARTRRPDLLVVDGLMPLLSGFEVLAALRAEEPTYKPIIFLVTAVFKSRKWESEARQTHQVHEYLEKPLELDVFVAALRRNFVGLVVVST